MHQSCFTGETLVATENGQKRIDEIEVGDKVWAYNVETGETELKEVLTVYVHDVDEILHLHTSAGDIDTTTNHPFYVLDRGWVAAGDLSTGDEIYLLDGTVAYVTGSELEQLSETIKVYNLEVADFNTYFVGDEAVLVHNYGGRLGNQQTRAQNKAIADELKAHGYEITGGGGYRPEEYLPNPNGGRRGGNYVDVTATKDGQIVRINTVDTYADGVSVTRREENAATSINNKTPNDMNIILIPKGAGIGDLLSILGLV